MLSIPVDCFRFSIIKRFFPVEEWFALCSVCRYFRHAISLLLCDEAFAVLGARDALALFYYVHLSRPFSPVCRSSDFGEKMLHLLFGLKKQLTNEELRMAYFDAPQNDANLFARSFYGSKPNLAEMIGMALHRHGSMINAQQYARREKLSIERRQWCFLVKVCARYQCPVFPRQIETLLWKYADGWMTHLEDQRLIAILKEIMRVTNAVPENWLNSTLNLMESDLTAYWFGSGDAHDLHKRVDKHIEYSLEMLRIWISIGKTQKDIVSEAFFERLPLIKTMADVAVQLLNDDEKKFLQTGKYHSSPLVVPEERFTSAYQGNAMFCGSSRNIALFLDAITKHHGEIIISEARLRFAQLPTAAELSKVPDFWSPSVIQFGLLGRIPAEEWKSAWGRRQSCADVSVFCSVLREAVDAFVWRNDEAAVAVIERYRTFPLDPECDSFEVWDLYESYLTQEDKVTADDVKKKMDEEAE